jgi:phosphatidylglycerol:prolipoprotein diacylglycerol transferase
VAFLLALWVASIQARKAGLDAHRMTDMAVWVLLSGLVGAKLLLVIVDWRQYAQSWSGAWSLLRSGGVFYGGLLGGLAAAVFFARRYQLPGWTTADVLAPAVALGQAVGRLGCFAAGCCYGTPTQLPWAIRFTDINAERQVGTRLGELLHPTQIYESLTVLAIFVFLWWLAPRKRFQGQVALAYVFLYSLARFTIEFVRGDVDRGLLFGGTLSTSQLIAIPLVIAATWLYLRRMPTPAKARATDAPSPSGPPASEG